MDNDTPADLRKTRAPPRPRMRLHGRVVHACDRCRRHKSRCDAFRPCSICLRAGVECRSALGVEGQEPRGRSQKKRSHSSRQDREAEPGRHHQLNQGSPENGSPARSATQRNGTNCQPDVPDDAGDPDPIGAPSPDAQTNPEAESTEAGPGTGQSMIGLTREIFQLSSRNFDQIVTSALPDGDPQPQLGDANLESLGSERLPILSVLGWQLPPETTMQALLEDYFVSVHWFSLVILEPKFRAQFDSIRGGYASPDQKPFLVLLSLVLALSSWYCSKRPSPGSEEPETHWAEWASTLIRSVESLMFEIMDGNTVEHIQTFILLGSFHCYHGKPKAAFSLLGAAIKTAQAISLHREPIRGTVNDVEERKRIWWTIYTWDRWSSITYGRPFGIDDRDCTISMPRDFYENRRFASEADQEDLVCYSAYQRELNKLYVTASPMLKSIFSARSSAPRNGGRRISPAWNLNLMNQTHHKLKHWRAALPEHLVLDVGQDILLHSSAAVRAHRLQALSLQLTFDHLIIFFHRSLLAKQLRIMSQPEAPESTVLPSHSSPSFLSDTSRPDSQTAGPTPSSPEEWWEAALRTSRVTQLPYTAQLATDGHLVAFLGINLLNAAIVLVICALTDPLTDRAQEAKRNITRVARMQEVLGKRSQLALQSSAVLRSMIYMIVQKEAEAMLASVESTKDPGSGDEPANTVQTHNQPSYSVEDALRLPLTAPGDGMNYAGLNSTSFLENHADEGRRLNESLATVQRFFVDNDLTRLPPTGILGAMTHLGHSAENVSCVGQGQNLPQNQPQGVGRDFGYGDVQDDVFWLWNPMEDVAGFQQQ